MRKILAIPLFFLFLSLFILFPRISLAADEYDVFLRSIVVIAVSDKFGVPLSAGTGFVALDRAGKYTIFSADHTLKPLENNKDNTIVIYILKSKEIIPNNRGLEYYKIPAEMIKIIYKDEKNDIALLQIEKKDVPVELETLKIDFERNPYQLGEEVKIFGYGFLGLPVSLRAWLTDYSVTNGGYILHLEKTNSAGLSGAPVLRNGKVIGFVFAGYLLENKNLKIFQMGNFALFKSFSDLKELQKVLNQ